MPVQLQPIITGRVVGGGLEGTRVACHVLIVIAADLGDGTAIIQEARVDGVDAAGLAITEWAQENAIHDGEDGRVEADADCQSDHDRRGKRSGAAKLPQRVA